MEEFRIIQPLLLLASYLARIRKFSLDRNTLFSKFGIENTTLNGYEIIRREDDICYAQGALYDNDELINAWTAIMKKK
jgi:hypothetical protein